MGGYFSHHEVYSVHFSMQKRILGVNALLEYTLNVFEGSFFLLEGLNCKGSEQDGSL